VYKNEYVVDAATSFILAANAAHAETKTGEPKVDERKTAATGDTN
jgi:hypothetical protein